MNPLCVSTTRVIYGRVPAPGELKPQARDDAMAQTTFTESNEAQTSQPYLGHLFPFSLLAAGSQNFLLIFGRLLASHSEGFVAVASGHQAIHLGWKAPDRCIILTTIMRPTRRSFNGSRRATLLHATQNGNTPRPIDPGSNLERRAVRTARAGRPSTSEGYVSTVKS
jgi:hypothetical protein